jgi:hypothetical protein
MVGARLKFGSKKSISLCRCRRSVQHASLQIFVRTPDLFEHACPLGCEGIVSKRKDSRLPHLGPRTMARPLPVTKPASPLRSRRGELDGRDLRLEPLTARRTLAGFALAVATSAQAITPAPIPQPGGMITQVAYGCGPGTTRVGGVCVARTTIRHTRRYIRRRMY